MHSLYSYRCSNFTRWVKYPCQRDATTVFSAPGTFRCRFTTVKCRFVSKMLALWIKHWCVDWCYCWWVTLGFLSLNCQLIHYDSRQCSYKTHYFHEIVTLVSYFFFSFGKRKIFLLNCFEISRKLTTMISHESS